LCESEQNMDASGMLRKVAARLRPGMEDEREVIRQLDFVADRLSRVIPKDVEIGMMGSAAKGTSLKNNREIDVFMLIPKRYSHEQMTTLGLQWAKKAMNGEKTEIGYANHPYLKVRRGGFKIDIVPSYKIENAEHLGSAVDRSQLHTVYVNGRINDGQRDGVRLLKQFCKTLGVYGAELKVEGFSGYLCELLVLNFGSFEKVMEGAAKWGERPMLDIENHHHKNDLAKMFDSPLIVIDPVDAKRNVAAVVSRTSLSRFIYAAREFCRKPSESFFFREKEVHSAKKLREMIKSRGTHIVVVHFKSPSLVEDILWPQLRKTSQLLCRALEKGEFRIFGSYFWSDGMDALVLFELMDGCVPKVARKMGPAVWHRADVDSFVKKHAGAVSLHFEHERIVAVEKRKIFAVEAALGEAIRDGKKLGIPSLFLAGLKKGKFTGFEGILKGKFTEVASDYISRKI
jgi:tRNA nucleotidyltransferase (CCA-adding enzyme)